MWESQAVEVSRLTAPVFYYASFKHCLGLESSLHKCFTTGFMDGSKILSKWIKLNTVF